MRFALVRFASLRRARTRRAPSRLTLEEDRLRCAGVLEIEELGGELRAGEVRAGEVRTVEVRAGEVRAGEVRASEVEKQDVALCISAPGDYDSCLNVRSGLLSPLLRTFAIHWPRLLGVLPDERGKYLHHGGMVFFGIAGDPLEGIDAADAHVELV